MCAPEVPCGAATAEGRGEHRASRSTPVSEESSVTDVLNKVATGEADAGLVYVTDVQRPAGDKVDGHRVPGADVDAVNVYPIASARRQREPDLARSSSTLVTGPRGPADPGGRRVRPAP